MPPTRICGPVGLSASWPFVAFSIRIFGPGVTTMSSLVNVQVTVSPAASSMAALRVPSVTTVSLLGSVHCRLVKSHPPGLAVGSSSLTS